MVQGGSGWSAEREGNAEREQGNQAGASHGRSFARVNVVRGLDRDYFMNAHSVVPPCPLKKRGSSEKAMTVRGNRVGDAEE